MQFNVAEVQVELCEPPTGAVNAVTVYDEIAAPLLYGATQLTVT